MLHPDLITDLVEPFLASDASMGTLKRRIESDHDLQNSGVVKVTTDRDGYALYFSRAPIPLVRDDPRRTAVAGLHFIHLGLYIYTRETLMRLAALPTGDARRGGKAGTIARAGTRHSNSRLGNHPFFITHRQPGRRAQRIGTASQQ